MGTVSNAWRRIGELFVEKSLITGPELEQALAVQAASGRPLGEVLVSQDLVSSPEMTEVILEQVGRKVAREEGFESGLWSEIRRRTLRMPEQRLATNAESAAELNERISQLTRHLENTQLALDQEREALATAENRIGELAALIARLQAEPAKRSQADASWRRRIERTLFGTDLHLAPE